MAMTFNPGTLPLSIAPLDDLPISFDCQTYFVRPNVFCSGNGGFSNFKFENIAEEFDLWMNRCYVYTFKSDEGSLLFDLFLFFYWSSE